MHENTTYNMYHDVVALIWAKGGSISRIHAACKTSSSTASHGNYLLWRQLSLVSHCMLSDILAGTTRQHMQMLSDRLRPRKAVQRIVLSGNILPPKIELVNQTFRLMMLFRQLQHCKTQYNYNLGAIFKRYEAPRVQSTES